MGSRRATVVAAAGFVLVGAAAAMADTTVPLTEPALPTFALTSPPADPSPWTGLYVGSEVFGITGGKNVRGGFGGAGYAGYNRELDNGIVVGVRGAAGYTPGFFKNSLVTGYDFATTDVLVGYDMGRFMPYVTAGVGLARPNLRGAGYGGVANSANDLFSSTGDLRGFETVGSGFVYQLTNNTSIGLAVQAYHGNGSVGP